MEPTKIYSNTNRPVTFAASAAVAISSSDTDVFAPGCLYVGTGGDVTVKMADSDTNVLFKNVADGTVLPLVVTMVLTTGTVSASDFVILY